VRITGHFHTEKWTVFNTPMDIYYAPYASFVIGLWPKLLPAVKRAVAATDSPSTANIYVTGHSLGGASAYMAGLALKEAGLRVSGVYAFDPYAVGHTCEPGEACWVSLYEKHLGGVTYSWWNNQDPVSRTLCMMHFSFT
jgi:pimeloyl-ACP methyl ester carboxylesterase